MTDKTLLYTGLFGDRTTENPVVFITVEGKAFLTCPNLCIEPLAFSEPDALSCPECNWQTTTQAAREILAGMMGHLLALYGMIEDWDPVGNIRARLEGKIKTDDTR